MYAVVGDRFTIGLHGKDLTDKRSRTSGNQSLVANPVTGALNRNAARNVVPSLGREGVVTAFYGNPGQMFVSLGVNL